jgi:iron complex transport system ATP-binding protein
VTPLATLDGVSVRRGARSVLRDVCLEVHAGEVVALVGPNGAGKSSLLEVLLGTRRPCLGQAYLGADPASALRPRDRARRVSLLEQSPAWDLPFSVEEYVSLPLRAHKPPTVRLTACEQLRVRVSLARVGLTGNERVLCRTLSGGERQRAGVARALVQGAALWLLDESAAHLDPGAAWDFLCLVREHADAGGAAVLVLHDLTSAARWADRLVLLDGGACVAAGTPREVFTPERVARTFGVQIELMPEQGAVEAVLVRGRCSPEAVAERKESKWL